MKVQIARGTHGNKVVENIVFPLVKPGIWASQKGPFVLVDGTGMVGFPDRNFRIHIKSPDDVIFESAESNEFHSKSHKDTSEKSQKRESDRAIKKRIAERFEILQEMTTSAATGQVRGIIVSGAAGVGKSYEVEQALARDSLMDQLSFNPDADDQDERRVGKDNNFSPRYSFIKGHMSPPALYKTLYDHSFRGEVLALDDCDSVWYDDTSLNLLKAALDTSRERVISWKTAASLGDPDLPDSFTYEGSLIVITNINFERTIRQGGKLAPHFDAMMDRCFYLDMTIDTIREKLLRIEQVAFDFGMLRKAGLTDKQSDEVFKFVVKNASEFRYLSLRKVVQIADLYKMGGNWKRKAEITLMKTA